MTDEPDAFESWGGTQGAPEQGRRSALRRWRPSLQIANVIPTGRLMPVVLFTLIVGAGGVVVAELTRSGPFAVAAVAAAPGTDAAAETAYGELPDGHWSWQMVAAGTDASSGQVDVRAWNLSRTCVAGAGCRLVLAREVFTRSAPDGTTDRTVLAAAAGLPAGMRYRARFAPVTTTCFYRTDGAWHSAAQSQTDSFTFQWSGPARNLIATEVSTMTGCGGTSTDRQLWTASRVAAPPTPALIPNPRHAPSMTAFRADAGRTCTAINAALEPYARRIVADRGVLHSAAAGARAKARADAGIAGDLAPLVPLNVREYTQTPQPPRGADDAIWLRDIALERSATIDGAAMIAATQAAAANASSYFLTRSAVDRQRAVAELFLANNDAERLAGPGGASAAIEKEQLRLPGSCLDSPAADEIFGAQVSVAA